MPAVAVLVIGVVAGAVATVVARAWPTADPGAPKLRPAHMAEELTRHQRLRATVARRVNPAEATGLVLTAAAVVAVAGAIAISALWLMVREQAGLERWDSTFARWGADHDSPTSTDVMRTVSLLGGTSVAVVVPVLVWLVDLRRGLPSRAVPAFLALVVAGQFALSNLVKIGVDRTRPDIERLTGFAGASFPSGHATAAAATFAACALVLGRRRSRTTKAVLTGTAVGIAAAVSATRVLLGVHWFTDVLAGIALGWAWFSLCSIAFGGRLLHFGTPVEVAQDQARSPVTGPVVEDRSPA